MDRPPPAPLFRNPPRKHVLLLSCMDTRLLDDTVRFMNGLNLQNRYDHLIFAGAAMGALRRRTPADDGVRWADVFFDHLTAAVDLLHRDIKDVILLEHLDCGAYKKLHPLAEVRDQYNATRNLDDLAPLHRAEAEAFATEVDRFCHRRARAAGRGLPAGADNPWHGIRVHCLVMDLLGQVSRLVPEPEVAGPPPERPVTSPGRPPRRRPG